MTPKLLEHVRAEALFVSDVQSTDALDPEHIRQAVMLSVRRHGPRGCAALVAHEFGSTPTARSAEWGWALDCVRPCARLTRFCRTPG